MRISLTPAEMLVAAQTGTQRQVQNLKKRRQEAYGAVPKNDWQLHIEGALGEYAVAKCLGIFWNGQIGKLRAGDVGLLQVRTRSRHDYDLIIHPDDEDNAVFILVTGLNGEYEIRGWILGRDGKNPTYWSDPAGNRPAFFVPKTALHSMTDLYD